MTQEAFLLNTFFAYFFDIGNYLLVIFAYALIILIIISLIKRFLI